MKTRDAHILILPGLGGGSPDHWYDRWCERLPTARRVDVPDWDNPHRDVYVNAILRTVAAAIDEERKPVIAIGHSLGTLALVHAAAETPRDVVRGAFLVGVPDLDTHKAFGEVDSYLPVPREPLPFPSTVIASRNDPYCDFDVASDLGGAWGSVVGDAGEIGHINPDSGHGAWPEGLLSLGKFLGKL